MAQFPGATGQHLSKRVLNRRQVLKGLSASVSALALGVNAESDISVRAADAALPHRRPYSGPNVIIIRFGGGVRRRETLDPNHSYSPYLLHQLVPRGTLFPDMHIADVEGVETSHGQGTLNILTGVYNGYENADATFLGERFEANVPTLFEYLRKTYAIPAEQTLIVNGEDRIAEEFYTFSNHHRFGITYRSNVLSLYRFKRYLLEQQLAAGTPHHPQHRAAQNELAKITALDHRIGSNDARSPHLQSFWERWRTDYGDSGLVNPRGDRALTELCIRAIQTLRPKLIMVNYNDCDYVHWGYLSHYTRGIQIMDEGLQRIVAAVEADEAYRDNTIFAIVPDCGRDNNRFVAVPCQHHFNTRSARDIFALFFGPGVPKSQLIHRPVDQISVAATLGALMQCPTPLAEGPVLEEAVA